MKKKFKKKREKTTRKTCDDDAISNKSTNIHKHSHIYTHI